jgi:hypothetical protein
LWVNRHDSYFWRSAIYLSKARTQHVCSAMLEARRKKTSGRASIWKEQPSNIFTLFMSARGTEAKLWNTRGKLQQRYKCEFRYGKNSFRAYPMEKKMLRHFYFYNILRFQSPDSLENIALSNYRKMTACVSAYSNI